MTTAKPRAQRRSLAEHAARAAAAAGFVALGVCATGCAPSLLDEYPFDGDVPHGERVVHEDLGGGVTRTSVDASAKEAWVYFDADTRAELPTAEALELQAWDLAFQRFKIITNSGVSGPGSVEVAALEGGDFEGLTEAVATGYQQDESDGSDNNSELDSAFLKGDGWYAYDLSEHKLAPREVVYVLKTGEEAFFALELLEYYDDAGNAGHVTFRWKPVAAPAQAP